MSVDVQAPDLPDRRWRTAGLVLAIAAAAVLVIGLAVRLRDAGELRSIAAEQAVPPVAVVTPGRGGTAGTLELPGRIEAYSRAPIYARTSGYVKSWHADIGTRVRNGQLLAEIETPDLDQQLLQAEAELANARANAALAATTAQRWQSLLATNVVSKQSVEEKTGDLDAKQSMVRALQANVERYRAMKQFARLVAPFDGVVTARSTDVGALVSGGNAGQALFVVSDTSQARVYVSVPQNVIASVKPGLKAAVTVPEQPNREYEATVQSRAQAIDVASGTMLVQLIAENVGGDLIPGQFARVRIHVPGGPGTLTVPSSALIVGKDGLKIATVESGDTIALKTVTLARDNGATVEVASGLDPADRVVESPPDGIASGDRVRVVASGAGAKK